MLIGVGLMFYLAILGGLGILMRWEVKRLRSAATRASATSGTGPNPGGLDTAGPSGWALAAASGARLQ